MATIHIPTPLRKFTGQKRTIETDEQTLSGAIEDLVNQYPDVKSNLLDEKGNVRSYVKIYIGDEEVNLLNNGDIELQNTTEVSIVPAIAGGNIPSCARVPTPQGEGTAPTLVSGRGVYTDVLNFNFDSI